ncbi:MAG: PAS domain S-box protein [Snowella sp.]|nr:PAS domain S-box protein [Snowella sp.]
MLNLLNHQPIDLEQAIARQPLLLVSPDMPLTEAIRMLSQARGNYCELMPNSTELQIIPGCLFVMEQGQLIGIITERDLVKLIAIGKSQLPDQTVASVMSYPVISLRQSELPDFFQVVSLLQRHKIRHLPILNDQGELIGCITHNTLRQVLRFVDLLRLRSVEEVMQSQMVTALPTDSMLSVAQLMARSRVSCVVIVNPINTTDADSKSYAKPIGIVTEKDIIQFQALEVDLNQTLVVRGMSSPLVTITTQELLDQAYQMMRQKRIQRLVVTGDRGELVGIVTQSSLLQALNPMEMVGLIGNLQEKVNQLELEKIRLLEDRNCQLENLVEVRTQQLQTQAQTEQLKAELALKIRNSIDLSTILDTAVTEIRAFLRADRVLIYRFDPDLSGQVIAESVQAGWTASIHCNIQDTCFQGGLPYRYRQGWVWTAKDIETANLTDCHRNLLRQFEVKANLVVPILVADIETTSSLLITESSSPTAPHSITYVWGLLIVHQCSQTRDWQATEITLLQQLADQIAIAIRQSLALERATQEIEERKKMELELRQANSKWQAFVENSANIIFIVDPNGTISFVNRSFDNYPPEALINQCFYDFIPVHLRQRRQENIQSVFQMGQPITDTGEVVYLQGSSVYYQVQLIPIWERKSVAQVMVVFIDITKTKQMELTLEQEVLRQEALFNASTDGIHTLDIHGKLIDFNVTFANMLGYDGEEIRGLNVADWDAEYTKSELLERLKYLLPRSSALFETKHRRKDGSILDVEISSCAMHWRDESVLVCISRDITERKQTQRALQRLNEELAEQVQERTQALQASEERWQILENMTEGLCVYHKIPTAPFAEFTIWNPKMVALTGYTLEEINRKNWYECLHPDPAQHQQAIERMRQIHQGENLQGENWEIVRADGQKRIFSISTAKMLGSGGRVNILALIQDITERQQMETALRLSEERFRRYFEQSLIGMAITSLEQGWLDTNQRLSQILGYSSEELRNLTWPEMTYPDDLAADLANFNRVLVGKIDGYEMDKRFIHKDGHIIYAQISVQCLRKSDGTVDFFVAMVQDISDRKKTEQELRESYQQLEEINAKLTQATRLKDEFLASMSHELRTPLNSILGFSEALQENCFGPLTEKQLKPIKSIEASGQHLLSLINDILDLSKIEAGKLELDKGPVSLTNLCEASLKFIQQQAFKKQIQLHFSIPKNIPNFVADERRLRQILINLLNNAVKFTPNGGQVSLTVQLDSQSPQPLLNFAISDTGIGIAEQDKSKLFQSFVQIDSRLARQYEGTGLGLSLVKRLVQLHGGHVTVESEVGQGSCFTVYLPYLPVNKTPTLSTVTGMPPETVSLTSSLESVLILLAEDNSNNTHTITSYLEHKGYRLVCATNGEEAIALAQEKKPHLILMDIQMPIVDGLEATRRIRLNSELAQIPIIALTALAMPGDRDRCLEAGMNDYVSKPIRMKQLVTLIEEHLTATFQDKGQG